MRLLTLLVALGIGTICLASLAPVWSPSREAILNTIIEETQRLELSAGQMKTEAEQIIDALGTLARQGAEQRLYSSLLLVLIPYAIWHLAFFGLWVAVAAWIYRYFIRRFRPLEQRAKALRESVERKHLLLARMEQQHMPPPPSREFLRRSSGR